MRVPLWYHPLGPCLRTACAAKQGHHQVPLAVSALSIPSPWKESKKKTLSTKSHSAVNCAIFYRTLTCTDYIREAKIPFTQCSVHR